MTVTTFSLSVSVLPLTEGGILLWKKQGGQAKEKYKSFQS